MLLKLSLENKTNYFLKNGWWRWTQMQFPFFLFQRKTTELYVAIPLNVYLTPLFAWLEHVSAQSQPMKVECLAYQVSDFTLYPLLHNPKFYWTLKRRFIKKLFEVRNAGNHNFLLLPQYFLPVKDKFRHLGHFYFFVTNAFNLDKSKKFLSFSKGLSLYQTINL